MSTKFDIQHVLEVLIVIMNLILFQFHMALGSELHPTTLCSIEPMDCMLHNSQWEVCPHKDLASVDCPGL